MISDERLKQLAAGDGWFVGDIRSALKELIAARETIIKLKADVRRQSKYIESIIVKQVLI